MTKAFAWSDEYLLGDETVDGEHQHLFEVANQAVAIWAPQRQQEELHQMMLQLHDYITTHFEHEEQLMRKLGYPGLEEHEAGHRRIIRSIEQLLNRSETVIDLSIDLQALMREWIVEHVQQEDMKIKQWQTTVRGPLGRLLTWLRGA